MSASAGSHPDDPRSSGDPVSRREPVQKTSSPPRVAITVGEAGGVGPELALRCVSMENVRNRCHPILVGPEPILAQIADQMGLPAIPAEVFDVGKLGPEDVTPGKFSAQSGEASFQAVDRAIGAAMAGEIDAIVTGPIQKEAWFAAGVGFPGHTELLAQRTGTKEYSMMLTSEAISCVLVTIHIPLADVATSLSSAGILRAIRHGCDAITRRLERPARVTVCGLNPHAGESGLISHGEEETLILPAIEQARKIGIEVQGPLPPDTAFTPRQRALTDVYVCMYHDQGLIPLKALAFDEAVNVTLGLPIVRTSVDHGTALDLAGTGSASPQSMLSAIHLAIDLC